MPKEFLNRLTALVEANLASEHFGIEELAREMAMSHSSIHRKLKEITNQNISQFIREIRLKKAKKLFFVRVATISFNRVMRFFSINARNSAIFLSLASAVTRR